MAKNFITKNSQYVQSLVDFILDTKPYHSKLTETIEEYQFFDNMNVKIEERFLNRTKMDSTWLYNYFSSENPSQRQMTLGRVYNPIFCQDTEAVTYSELTDMAGVPFVYSKKNMIDHPGPSAVFIQRADKTIEPLQESLDFFTNHGAFQFRIIQTQNTNQFTHIASSQAQMLSLDADVGDTVARADLDKVFQLSALPVSTLGNWVELQQALLNPLYVSTLDENIVAAATAKTRSAALDISTPQSAVRRVGALLDEIQLKVDAHPDAQVQIEIDALRAILAVPNLPQSYEALLNFLAIHPEIDVDETYYKNKFQELSSPLFFYQFSDTGIRESGLVNYSDVLTPSLRVYQIRPDFNGSYEEWILTAMPGDYWQITGSTSGFVGYVESGADFFSIGKIAFKTEMLGSAVTGTIVSLIPDHKITIHKNAPLETWNIIKVNSIAHSRPQLVSDSYGKIQNLSGATGLVTLLDPTLPTTTVILEAREGGLIFDLTSTEDLNHQGIATVNQVFNDGRLGFTIVPGVTPFRKGDRFYIAIENKPASAIDLDLGYGYDLNPYDGDSYVYNNTDPADPNYNRKIGWWYDCRFTDFDVASLNLVVGEEAISGRMWRMRALPGVPLATLKKDSSGPNYIVDLTEPTSGSLPDPGLTSIPVLSMPGDANPDPDLFAFYSTSFVVEWSDDGFLTFENVGVVPVGGSFESAEHGISFTLPPASKPYIAVSSDDGSARVEGGDVFSFTIRNPFPELVDIPIGIISPNVPRLILHSDSFYEAPAAHWTVKFNTPSNYTVVGVSVENGTEIVNDTRNITDGLSYHDHDIHFTIVPTPQIYAGDVFVFDTFEEKPSYLVHGSLTGWTKPAKMGKYYWNGKIGFKLTLPEWNVYVNGDQVDAASVGVSVSRIREDITSVTYIVTFVTPGNYMVSRSDVGVIGHMSPTDQFKDKFITFNLDGTTVQELKIDINAHQYPLFNAQDTIIVKQAIAARDPRQGDSIVVEKPEAGKLQISLSQSSADISALAPITIDQRFIDISTGQDIPLSVTSPYANVLQGFLPMIATHYDNYPSIAEFRDSATRIEYRSAANGQLIGTVKPLTLNLDEPTVFEWDLDFYNAYLPLNAEANVITMGTGWNDKLRAHITESIKFLIGGGPLAENFLFREIVAVDMNESYSLNVRMDLANAFSVVLADGPFEGFLSGWDNHEYDNEPIGYDEGHPPDIVSLLSKFNITQPEIEDILTMWAFFVNDRVNPPTTAEQWQFIYDNLPLDPNPGTGTNLGFGYPLTGMAIDIVDRSLDASATEIQEAMVVAARDFGNPHDMYAYGLGNLDEIPNEIAMMFTTSLPPIPASIEPGTTYDQLDTPLYAVVPSRVFEINFSGTPSQLAAIDPPFFSIWSIGAQSPQEVPASLVTKLGAGRYRFSIPAATEAKILVGHSYSGPGGGSTSPPVAVGDSYTIDQDSTLSLTTTQLMVNDTGSGNTLVSVQSPVNGAVTLVGNTVTFVPTAGYSGSASFTYTIMNVGGSSTAAVVITVDPVVTPDPEVPEGITDENGDQLSDEDGIFLQYDEAEQVDYTPVGFVAEESPPPPPPTVFNADRTFQGTPYLFEFADEFNGTGAFNGRQVETVPPGVTPYVWNDSSGVSTVSGGVAHVLGANGSFYTDYANDEYDMPTGIFIETEYDSSNELDQVLIAWALGGSNASMVIGGYDGGHTGEIRADAGGFNGALDSGGFFLPADPDDTTGTDSASFTSNRVYTGVSQDWRNRVIRLEVTANRFTLKVDGVVYIDRPTRFDMPLYSSRNDLVNGNYGGLSLWGTPADGSTPVDIKYVRVGPL